MGTIGDKKYPHVGDIIEYNGKKYYTKQWVAGQPCCFEICALRNQCNKFGKEFNCEGWHYFLTIKQAIAEEKRKIKDSENLIKKIQKEL